MVFTRLSAQEKEAFFELLDEYFQSRPEIFGHDGAQEGSTGPVISTAAAASIAQRAIAASGAGGGAGKSNNPYVANLASNPEIHNAVGRVAAASLAFSNNNSQTQGPKSDPPTLPSRTANPPVTLPSRVSLEQVAIPGAEIDKLVTKKTGVFGSFKKPQTAGTVIPPAFTTPKSSFGPPPVRRTTSDTSSGATSPAPSLPRRQAAPAPEPEEPEGEWAEVLYDYGSEDAGDLAIEAGTMVLVTAKSSDDWWTGQIDGRGREGLFPASYVKLL